MSRSRRKRKERRRKQRRESSVPSVPSVSPVASDSSPRFAAAIGSAVDVGVEAAGTKSSASRRGAGPASTALFWAALALAFVLTADLCEFLLTSYLDAPTIEYLQKFLARHWRETDYGLPFVARYLGAGSALAGFVYLAFLGRRVRLARAIVLLATLAAAVWFFLRGASFASMNVKLNAELLAYLIENGGLVFGAEGADTATARVPIVLYCYLSVFAGLPIVWAVLSRSRQPGPEQVHRWHHGLATLVVFVLASSLSFFSSDGLAGSLTALEAPEETTAAGAGAAGGANDPNEIPPPEISQPATFPFENAFRRRYGFHLKRGTNVVVFFLESARAAFVPLNETKYFRPGDRRVIAVDDFFVPVPHSSNSHYSLFTGLHSARKAKDQFDALESQRSLPGALVDAGYAAYYLYGGDARFDAEHKMVAALKMQLRDKKYFAAKRDERGRRLYKEFWWGVDDRALLEETRAILDGDGRDRPLFLSIVYTNSHHRYFNPHPDRYKQYDNDTDIGRHRNAIRYALDLSDLVVEEFAARGRARDTLFILLSDHGESFGEHGFIVHDFSLYNTEVKVPFAMRHPDFRRLFDRPKFPAGSVLDVYPTAADMLGLPYAGELHGRSLFARDYRLRLLLRAWGSDDYVGLIDGGTKWLYARPRRELLRMDLADGAVQAVAFNRRARAFVDGMYARSFGDRARPADEDAKAEKGAETEERARGE